MMRRYLMRLLWSIPVVATLFPVVSAFGQAATRPGKPSTPAPRSRANSTSTPSASDPAARSLVNALAADPATAPYQIRVETRNGKYVLKGKVGTTDIHNAALRIAIDSGLPFLDELVTDTGEAYRSATSSNGPVPMFTNSPVASAYDWVYPEPLFGRLDEPFAGMEPPAISYPPDWSARNYRKMLPPAYAGNLQGPLPPNTVEMTIDPRGVALLRGTVPTDADRIEIGQELAQSPGVSGIINQLDSGSGGPPPGYGQPRQSRPRSQSLSDTPPPPPRPMPRMESKSQPIANAIRPADTGAPAPAPAPAPTPATKPKPQARTNPLEIKVNQAVQRVPELRGVDIHVKASEGGLIRLSGKVAGIREAMLAYRSVQTTPGVTAIFDTLEFPPPDESKRNPLTVDSSPDDVEPYISAQLARHLGDLAHVDRVRLESDRLDLRTTIDRPEDQARAEAILRTLPLLRGFKVETKFRLRP